MKTAEQQEDNLLFTIGRLSYCATQNDWKRFEMILRAFTNQVQSDAIENTVRRCAEIAKQDLYAFGRKDEGWRAYNSILSLIPQKEKKV